MGSASLTYSVAPNSGAARNATLVIAGVNYVVSQSGVVVGTYCSSQGSSTGFEWISDHDRGWCTARATPAATFDFTAGAAIALARGSNAASLVPGFSSGVYTENWRIWIDFNHDSVFSDTEIVSHRCLVERANVDRGARERAVGADAHAGCRRATAAHHRRAAPSATEKSRIYTVTIP
jgi:hypothetical protein